MFAVDPHYMFIHIDKHGILDVTRDRDRDRDTGQKARANTHAAHEHARTHARTHERERDLANEFLELSEEERV
jgi:hypothetical protein